MSEAKTLKSGIVQKTCQRCGKIFDCGATANSCECFSVNLPPEIVKQLQTNYGDCLCVSCLKDLNGKQKPKIFDGNQIVSEERIFRPSSETSNLD
ncbi:cysteine-rich CWC [Leptospira borgpetersenii serovar Pomona str. 200901868]|uniref:Cysteine-rich CWC n=1 Tax=Leptospira borgpetersenii serovar Pomona str. 200901868 TaxID=1192866 RepID=M6WHD4_LEPBO|nr:cysteine-rich CWC [Leptospira borgpetersenii serovar Pomona str. 200901868]